MARLDFADEPLRIASASVVGVLERLTKSKRYVFQVDLEWSDGRKSTRSVTTVITDVHAELNINTFEGAGCVFV